MRTLSVLLLCLGLSGILGAVLLHLRDKDAVPNKAVLSSNLDLDLDVERRGCCSWHQEVCGCSAGRAVCCDGMLSPTCGC